AAGLGQRRRPLDVVGRGGRADVATHLLDQLGAQRLARFDAFLQGHVGVDALALDVVREADHRGLGHRLVRDPRALALGGGRAVAVDVDHVVPAAGDPPLAVGAAARVVAGAVGPREGPEVGVYVALVVTVNGAHLPRPRVQDHQVALGRAL